MNSPLSRIVLTLGLLAGSLAPIGAFAHSPLTGSLPRDGAVVSAEQAPRQLKLQFGHALRLTSVTLLREGVKKVTLKPASKPTTAHALDLPALSPGNYSAQWRGMAADGHVMSGTIRFKVATR